MRAAGALAAALFAASALAGEPPTLEHVFPLGLERGTTNTVAIAGKFEPWPPRVWIDQPGLVFNAETNKGKFQVMVAADARPGPRLIRLYNDDGASEPKILAVSAGGELMEAEPNDRFDKAQRVSGAPVTINGHLARRGDVDSFAIDVPKGGWLDARVDSHTYMAKLDAVLRLVTTQGIQLAWNHDHLTLDPRLVWQAPADQTVIVQVFGFPYPAEADIRLGGGEGCVYRLQLNTGALPPLAGAFPAPAESEPNDRAVAAQWVSFPFAVPGMIDNPRDEDWFRATLRKGQWVEARVEAAALGSPLDARLAIHDEEGKQLAQNDDEEGSADPAIYWQAPAGHSYYFAVSHMLRQGGEEFRYRLAVREALPELKVSLAASSTVLAPGTTNEVKYSLRRLRGFTNELAAAIRGLPAGVSAIPEAVPAKDGEGTLKLVCAKDAAKFQGPVTLVLADKTANTERIVPFDLVSRTVNNGVPGGYASLVVEQCDHFWLTVRPPPEPAASQTAQK